MTDYAYVLASNPAVPNSIDFGTGLVAVDATGALAPEHILLNEANGIGLYSTNGATAAQYIAACEAFLKRRGAANIVSPTPAALPDGTWS
jgi:hypothetical protein